MIIKEYSLLRCLDHGDLMLDVILVHYRNFPGCVIRLIWQLHAIADTVMWKVSQYLFRWKKFCPEKKHISQTHISTMLYFNWKKKTRHVTWCICIQLLCWQTSAKRVFTHKLISIFMPTEFNLVYWQTFKINRQMQHERTYWWMHSIQMTSS